MATTTTTTLQERKQELIESSEDYRHEVEVQLKDLQNNAVKWAGAALAVGGTAYAGYLIIKRIKGKKKNNRFSSHRPVNPRQALTLTAQRDSTIVRMVKEQITLFMIATIKQKLVTLLEDLKVKDARKTY